MPKVYIVKTNKTYNINSEENMITERKVAAYYSPCKYFIDEIETGDIVCFYSNGKGIIARGNATGKVELRDSESGIDEEHYMHLDRLEPLDNPLSSIEIIEIAKSNTDYAYMIKWNQTIIQQPYFIGLRVLQHMTKFCIN